jgi:hypothetical protein
VKKNSNNPKGKNKSSENFDPSKFKTETELTTKAIQNFLVHRLDEKLSKKRDLDALINTVQEFLNCFIIIGYNFEGEPVNFISAHNQQEADSLATLVNKLFIQQNSGRDSS